jgi:capsular polysaccharide biosynthesis protein
MPGSEGRPTPEVVTRVRAGVAPWPDAGASPGGERIYVTREQARRRRVANEAELWAQLERRGFVKLRLEALTWREQIHAFRRAKVVVAPHGAGLANLVFCEAGTRVVEFFNRAYVNGNFWRLAALRGLDYRPIVAAGAEPLAQIAAQGREDIVVDVSAVMRAV